MAAAVKFRDLQIENIKGLYDYEMREADSVYHASVTEMKTRMAEELRRRIEGLKREKRLAEKRAAHQDHTTASLVEPSSSPSIEMENNVSISTGSLRSRASINEVVSATSFDGNKSSSSAAITSKKTLAGSSFSSSTSSSVPSSTSSASTPSMRSALMNSQSAGLASSYLLVSESVSDEDARNDLRQIVSDYKAYASAYAAMTNVDAVEVSVEFVPVAHGVEVDKTGSSVSVSATSSSSSDIQPVLVCDGKRYFVGQPITIHSQRSSQDFPGVIVRIDVPEKGSGVATNMNGVRGKRRETCSGGSQKRSKNGEGKKPQQPQQCYVPGVDGGEVLARLTDGTYARVGFSLLKTGRMKIKAGSHISIADNTNSNA
jgi:hypothetical protein